MTKSDIFSAAMLLRHAAKKIEGHACRKEVLDLADKICMSENVAYVCSKASPSSRVPELPAFAALGEFRTPKQEKRADPSGVDPASAGIPGKRIFLFSNVPYPESRKIATRPDDILVFLNKAASAAYYADSPAAAKIVFRRKPEESYGVDVPGTETRFVFDGSPCIPREVINRIKSRYDWDYPIEEGKVRCATTGYMVAEYLHEQYPDRTLVLVNFGYEVKHSTYRCPWHNWRFEAEELKKYLHIFTAETGGAASSASGAGPAKKRILYKINPWLGDTIYASAVVRAMAATGKISVNVASNRPELWANCPWTDATITEDNADVVISQRNVYGWSSATPHIVTGTAAAAAQDLGIDIPVADVTPAIWLDLPPERLIAEPYILVNAGWQNSAETKKWSRANWLKFLDLCPEFTFVQTGQRKNHAIPLRGAIDMIDKTSDADLIRLVRDAECVISPPSGVIHIAGAFGVPFVSLAGGREPASLVTYPCGEVLSSCGELPCCKNGGCRLSHWEGKKMCKDIVLDGDECTGRCMTMISPRQVREAMRRVMGRRQK